MTIFSKFKSMLILTALVTFIVPVHTQADEYKWLKTSKYKNIFVYTDFEECDFLADELNETIERILSRSKIKPTISNSLVFQSTEKKGNSINELLDPDLIGNRKIFLHIYGKCIEYGSVHLYQFDIHFAVFNNKYSQALLYSTPKHSVMGADRINAIKRAFKKLIENTVVDYVSANTKKRK